MSAGEFVWSICIHVLLKQYLFFQLSCPWLCHIFFNPTLVHIGSNTLQLCLNKGSTWCLHSKSIVFHYLCLLQRWEEGHWSSTTVFVSEDFNLLTFIYPTWLPGMEDTCLHKKGCYQLYIMSLLVSGFWHSDIHMFQMMSRKQVCLWSWVCSGRTGKKESFR